jgi:hypothetical protein
MEILTGILCLLQITEILFKIKEKINSQDEKQKISDLLKGIGNLIESVAADLEQNVYSHNKCSQMEHFMHSLHNCLKGKIAQEQVDKLVQLMQQSVQVEQLFGQMQQLDDVTKKENINQLKSSAGSFIAMSQTILL